MRWQRWAFSSSATLNEPERGVLRVGKCLHHLHSKVVGGTTFQPGALRQQSVNAEPAFPGRHARASWWDESMTVTKVTVSLDPAVADRAKRDVAAGRAKSVSSWINEAAKVRIEREDLEIVLAELLDATGGPPSEAELTDAATRSAGGNARR